MNILIINAPLRAFWTSKRKLTIYQGVIVDWVTKRAERRFNAQGGKLSLKTLYGKNKNLALRIFQSVMEDYGSNTLKSSTARPSPQASRRHTDNDVYCSAFFPI